MKLLSKVCSVLLLGATLFSGSSFAMDDAIVEKDSRPPLCSVRQVINIEGWENVEYLKKILFNLNCSKELQLNITGKVRSLDNITAPDFDWSKLRNWMHGVYFLPEAVAEVMKDGSISKLSSPLRVCVSCDVFYVEGIEEQRGPMVGAALSILSVCPDVQDLNLDSLTINLRGVQALQETGKLSFLRKLEIIRGKMDDDAVALLFSNPLPILEELYLVRNKGITGAGFSKAVLPSLKSLDLSTCNVGAAGLQEVAQSRSPLLKRLYLDSNRIDLDALRVACWGDRKIEKLVLDDNCIGTEGALFLANPSYLPGLEILSLKRTKIGIDGLRYFEARWSSLKYLYVVGSLTDEEREEAERTLVPYNVKF